MRRLSLTFRLTALYTLVAAMLLIGMAVLVALAVDRHFEDLDHDTLQDKLHLVGEIISRSDSTSALQIRLDEALRHHPGLFVRVQDGEGALLYASAAFEFPAALGRDEPAKRGKVSLTWTHDGHDYQGLAAQIPPHQLLGHGIRVLAAVDTLHHAHFIESLQLALGAYVLLAAIASGLLGWWAARTGLAPLRTMKAQAHAITAHRLDQRMPADSVPVELADLATSLNEMLTRLQGDFQRLSDFSSDLAHELRTPISNLLTQTQVALSSRRDANAYRDILASNAEELQRLARMVSDMLLLAKAEHGLLLPRIEDIALEDEVGALFDFYEALAEEKKIQLQESGAAHFQGDRLMLRRAISNLLSNALRHTPAGGLVSVEIESLQATVALHVTNTGPAIPPELLPRLFDRFFRADKARTHPETEGAGLGLAITRAIVQAHGGSASVTSIDDRTRFTLSFPLA